MKIPSQISRRWLLPAALVTAVAVVGAAWWLVAGQPPEAPVTAPPPIAQAPPPAAAPAAPERPAAPAEAPDIFALRTWEAAEPPAAAPAAEGAPAPAAPPEAPPLPFRYLGKVEAAGQAPVIFLARDEQVLAVRPGDSIDRAYRVVRLKKDEVLFLYRPLRIEQALSMGADT